MHVMKKANGMCFLRFAELRNRESAQQVAAPPRARRPIGSVASREDEDVVARGGIRGGVHVFERATCLFAGSRGGMLRCVLVANSDEICSPPAARAISLQFRCAI
uniref:Uncharacterized protein n=1 Tax=Plectus sambesii TaxID=2011161 RepID=A0A914UKT4_9BILA